MEWLTRDPLNGIVISIAFFTCLIIGRYLRKKKAEASKKMDSRVKILISFLMIISITFMKNWYFPAAASFLCIIIAVRLNIFHKYSKKIVFPLVLAFFILIIQSFSYGVKAIEIGGISAYADGIEYGFLIFARVLASASLLILLALTTSEDEMLESLRYFRVPGTLIEISSFMSRYIRTFSKEGKKLKLAQEARCGFAKTLGFRNRMQNIASISGLLIIRAFSRSEDVYRAMLSRCWKEELRYSKAIQPITRGDAILGILLSFTILALAAFDRYL